MKFEEVGRAYDTLMDRKRSIRSEVKRDFQQAIADEIEARTEGAEKMFGAVVKAAFDAGMTRRDLAYWTRSNDWSRIKKWQELAGVTPEILAQSRATANEEALMKALGIIRAGEGFFQIVGQDWRLVWQKGALMPEPFKDFDASVYVPWYRENAELVEELRVMEGN